MLPPTTPIQVKLRRVQGQRAHSTIQGNEEEFTCGNWEIDAGHPACTVSTDQIVSLLIDSIISDSSNHLAKIGAP